MMGRKIILLCICSLLTLLVLFSSCAVQSKSTSALMNARYRLDITLYSGANFNELIAIMTEYSFTKTNNQNYGIEISYQDFRIRSGTISFTVSGEAAMQDFCRRIQSEGIAVQSLSIQKID
jgi:hypothetical protein